MTTIRSKVVGNPNGVTSNWIEDITPQLPGGDPVYPYLASVDYYGHEGENIENYHARKKRGELLPMTNWYQVRSKGSVTSGTSASTTTHTYVSKPNRDVTKGAWFISNVEMDAIQSRYNLHEIGPVYVTEAAAKIYSSGFDSLTFVSELHKTIRMFRNFGKNLITTAKSKELWKTWLEGRYGWRILVFEMFDLHETLCNLDLERKRWRESSGSTMSDSETFSTSWVGGYGTYHSDFQQEIKVGVRGTIVADVSPPNFQFNPIVTAWELIPYSFVIDWFVRVGSWLASLSFLLIQSQHFAAYGYTIKVTRRLVNCSLTPKTGWTIDSINGTSEHVLERTFRSPTTVPFVPSKLVKLDVGKITDLVSLALQLRR